MEADQNHPKVPLTAVAEKASALPASRDTLAGSFEPVPARLR